MERRESLDELLMAGDINGFLAKMERILNYKLAGKSFAGVEMEDVTQEVLLKVYKSISAYDSTRTKANTFFNKVADNKIKDVFRSLGSESNLRSVNYAPLMVGGDDEDSSVLNFDGYIQEDFEYNILVHDVLHNYGLSDIEKSIFELRAQDYTYTEIAGILNTSKQAVSYHKKGIEAKLSQVYEEVL